MFDLILLVVYIIDFLIFFISYFYSNKLMNRFHLKSELCINWIIINYTNHANVFQVSIKFNK